MSRIASNVRRIRAAHPWTQEEVAARAGRLSPRLYRQIESGTTNLTAATLTRIAEALEVDVAALLVPATPPQPKRGRPRKNPYGDGHPSSPAPHDHEGEGSAEAARTKPAIALSGSTDGLDQLGVASTPPSLLGTPVATPPAAGTDVDPAGEALTEATHLARRVGELRRELEDRRNRLVREVRQVESALFGLVDTPGGGHPAAAVVVPRVTPAPVVVPPLQAERSVRGAVEVLLRANPGGLRTTELAEALHASHLRPRKNELHNVVRSLFDAGALVREGFRGGYVYRLRDSEGEEHEG